jgi:hypothetical protein
LILVLTVMFMGLRKNGLDEKLFGFSLARSFISDRD